MKHTDVILCLHGVMQGYKASRIMLRTDNGSRFIGRGLREFCMKNGITREFTHVSTPEEKAYMESLLSLVEKEVIRRYEFDSLYHARDVLHRYFNRHNNKKRRHALGTISPAEYCNTALHSHPVKPPQARSGELVKGDDAKENTFITSSLVLPLINSERELPLLNEDDNESVINHFIKSVPKK